MSEHPDPGPEAQPGDPPADESGSKRWGLPWRRRPAGQEDERTRAEKRRARAQGRAEKRRAREEERLRRVEQIREAKAERRRRLELTRAQYRGETVDAGEDATAELASELQTMRAQLAAERRARERLAAERAEAIRAAEDRAAAAEAELGRLKAAPAGDAPKRRSMPPLSGLRRRTRPVTARPAPQARKQTVRKRPSRDLAYAEAAATRKAARPAGKPKEKSSKPPRVARLPRVAATLGVVAVAGAGGAVAGASRGEEASSSRSADTHAQVGGTALAAPLAELTAARSTQLGRLRSADDADKQAAAAKELTGIYHRSAKRLREAQVSTPFHAAKDSLVARVKNVGRAYGGLAAAAEAGRSSAYMKRRDAVVSAEASLGRWVRRLRG